MSRSYRQYCGLARALDVVGDRWNLLIVRQLLLAPARYGDLLAGLPGVATNLLTDRLRDLEAAGVVERRPADDGNALVYALTPWGSELREPIDGLIRWSTPLMVRGPEGDRFQPDWLLLAFPALLEGRSRPERPATVGMAIDDHVIQLVAGPEGFEVRPHDGRELDATLRTNGHVALGLVAGEITLDEFIDFVEVEGDEGAVRSALGA